MSAGQAIYGILSTTTAVTNLVGTRIDPQFSPKGVYPCIVFEVDDLTPMESHDGPTNVIIATVAIQAVARTKAAALAVLAAVKATIDSQKGTWGGVVVPLCGFVPPATEEFLSAEDTGEQDQLVSITHNYSMWYLTA